MTFKIGQHVRKLKGHIIGTYIGAFGLPGGGERIVVSIQTWDPVACAAADPLLHIYLPEQFEAVPEAPPAAETERAPASKITRREDTPEAREFWASAERTAAEVETWPAHRRAGINEATERAPAPPLGLCDEHPLWTGAPHTHPHWKTEWCKGWRPLAAPAAAPGKDGES